MIKKIFALLLSLTVIICTFSVATPIFAATNAVSVWDGKLYYTDADGITGTTWYNSIKDNSVIEVYTANQLAFLAYMSKGNTYSGQTIKLMTDIDLDNKLWLPIGDVANKDFCGFCGTFDGNGHTIKNLKGKNLESPSGYSNDRATFGLIGILGGTVKNLIIENVTYDLDLSVVPLPKVGAICAAGGYWTGKNNVNLTATIQNCAVKNVTFNITNTATFETISLSGMAAVCGVGYRATTIKDTYAKNVKFNFETAVSNFHQGGFANHMRDSAKSNYTNCYLADAKESVANAEPTDLRFGYFEKSNTGVMKLCYTTSNATESTNISTGTSGANVLRVNTEQKYINYGLTTSNTTGSYSADTANVNDGYAVLTMEAVPVYNLTITKNGDKFTASAVFNNLPDTAMLCFAVYDKTTDMLVFADAIDSNITTKEITGYDPAKHVVKAFVWDMSDCTPLVNPETYTQ